MGDRQSDTASGVFPETRHETPWPDGDRTALPWKVELDTADRRLRELEELFLEDGREKGPEPDSNHP